MEDMKIHDTPRIEKTSEEIASEIVEREISEIVDDASGRRSSDSLDEEKVIEQRDILLECCQQLLAHLYDEKHLDVYALYRIDKTVSTIANKEGNA